MSGWIAVEDRLPESTGFYMVKSRVFRHGKRLEDAVSKSEFDGKFFQLSPNELEGFEYRIITHWMPLPPAPKQEQ
jgi:hypothetical protein